jgi:transposase
MTIKYSEPQMIQSRGEQLDAIMKERELGLKSRIDALMELNGIDREAALAMAAEIDKDELIINGQDQGTQINGIGSQPNN